MVDFLGWLFPGALIMVGALMVVIVGDFGATKKFFAWWALAVMNLVFGVGKIVTDPSGANVVWVLCMVSLAFFCAGMSASAVLLGLKK